MTRTVTATICPCALLLSPCQHRPALTLYHSPHPHTTLGRLVMLLPDTFDPQKPRGIRWNYISATLTALTSELHLPTQTPSPPPTTDDPQDRPQRADRRRGMIDTESTHCLLLNCKKNLGTLKGFIKGACPSTVSFCPLLPCPVLSCPVLSCPVLSYAPFLSSQKEFPASIECQSEELISFSIHMLTVHPYYCPPLLSGHLH